ncbi:SIMPL domain-containing protein [Thermomonas sp. S9]|uniref:SIMPL domain-containing protein n=2 Tax=unclassified Thermomonas TaxID=2633315 RepID=UPI00216AF07B|nr:SIMPL domain-containing protein [Thermomonas sp. S9]MCR6495649.1 SIMPL domain-containing protein [Thermomonas sp. S9]
MTLRPLLLALALAATLPMTSHAQSPATAPSAPAPAAQPTLLSVSASAEASRKPDIATLSTGVVTQASDANAAMRENAQRMDRVLAALRAAGIAERDIQTSGINLNPQYKYVDGAPPAITGYQASNTVNVKVRDLARLGKVLDTLVAQGANQINGPSFGIDRPEEALQEARIAAVRKAQAMARTYADALGMRVLRVVSLSEGGTTPPRPLPVMRVAAAPMAMMEKDTAVAAGESSVSVTIEMVFELGH